ncbi:MAG: hypothetical protein IID46_13460 [Planctomycetes bacterium]|nr:hypothetical protein [Planctomycetota bacterium]
MKRFVILVLFAVGIFVLGVFQPGDTFGNANLFQTSGSTVQIQGVVLESGSRLAPGRTRRITREAGSSYRYQSRNTESGSSLRRYRSGREAGSELRDRGTGQESGSFIGQTPGSRNRSRNPDRPRGDSDRRPGDSPAPQADREFAETGGFPSEAQIENASLILIALLILMIGGVGGYYLFRGAAALAPNRELWTKQVELCCEIIQQMDAIITEAQAQDWDRCRDSMDALRELSGRRTILLANDINRAAIVFLAAATYCVQREECTSHFEDMRLSFHTAINAMRKIANSEPMTDDVHRLLDASHQQMRVIRRKESGAA